MEDIPRTWALGFDLGSREAACALVENQDMLRASATWRARGKPALETRLRTFRHWARECLAAAEGPHILVVAAEMTYSRFVRAAILLSWQLGLVHGLAIERGLAFLPISPQIGKATLAGKGNASKAEMVAMAKAITGQDLTEHEADAYGVALAALDQVRQEALMEMAEAHK